VNAPIVRVHVLVTVLFALLVVMTTWNAVIKADEREDNPKNRRLLLEQAKIHRGLIRAADGTVLARSVKRPDDTYRRTYPDGLLFGHAVGYSFTTLGRAGTERFRNDALTGEDGELGSIIDRLSGAPEEGDDVRTSLDRGAQRVAFEQLQGRKGAVVALDPRTGAVKVMASLPRYDPADLAQRATFRRLNRDRDAPLLNRTTQAGYPPGSTFKVVTAIAAIDSGDFSPDSRVSGRNGKRISGVPLNNFANADFGDITLTDALTRSVNTVWAEVGEKLGKETMGRYMERLGFNTQVEVDLPADERRASGEYRNGRLLAPTSRFVDVGRMAIGQDKLAVAPLQMAMVAAAVANGGRLMKPRITDRITDRDGRVVDDVDPEELGRVMSSGSAAKVRDMMANVVREGSGTAAALEGIDVAGKTGTAEKNVQANLNQPWFIGFAPADDPKVAVAVTIESTVGGTGGQVAAPIARAVMQELLR